MDENDKRRFAMLMMGLAEDCSVQLTSTGIEFRFDALREYSLAQVEAAIRHVQRTNVYNRMPTTGAIIKALEQTDGDRVDSQIQAIRDEIRRIGSYGSPVFTDPVTDDLVRRRFGWGQVCAMSDSEFEWFAKSFRDAYLSGSKAVRLAMIDPSRQIEGPSYRPRIG